MAAKLDFPRGEAAHSTGRLTKNTGAFGALVEEAKDQLYLLRSGFIYTSPWVVTKSTTRFSASILLTTKHAPIELFVDDKSSSHQAVAIKPVLERGLRAENLGLVSIQVGPHHQLFRRFRGIASPGYLSLPRDAYVDFDPAMELAYDGKLSINDAAQLLEDVVSRTSRYLPRAKRSDPRIERALEMLQENPNYPLTELSAAIGLSYDRMSHLFAEVVGLPLRSYLLWRKIHAASLLRGSGLTLTEISDAAGFTDSAHLCNTWQQAFGMSPSAYFVDSEFVEIHAAKQRKEATHHVTPMMTAAAPIEATSEKGKFCYHCGSVHA